MEPFKVHIMGCGSAMPTLRHHPSSQIIEIRGKLFMVDCGEGTQIQLRRYKIRFPKISAVFISHLHGDHCFGLLGMMSTFGMVGRTAPLHVYAPADYESMLTKEIDFFCQRLEFQIEFHPIDTTCRKVIYEDRSLTVETIPLEHRIPCCGYLFKEKPTLPHICRDIIDCYNVPVSQINNIKLGADWTTEDGEVIPNNRFVVPSDPPRSYAYCSDTRYMSDLYKTVKGVNLLYHESTYIEVDAERARMFYHSTARQAAQVAKASGVGKLLLGHYSARYDDEKIMLSEAKKVFPNSYLTHEGDTFDVNNL